MLELEQFKAKLDLVDGQYIPLAKPSKGGDGLVVVSQRYPVPSLNFRTVIRDGRNQLVEREVNGVMLTNLFAELDSGLVAVGKRDWYLWASEGIDNATASGNMHTQFKNPEKDWERIALERWGNPRYQEFSLMVDEQFGGQGLADLLTVLSLVALKGSGIRKISTASDLGHSAADRIWVKLGWEGDRTIPTLIDPIATHPYVDEMLNKWVLNQGENI
jgi:hypothetical protein